MITFLVRYKVGDDDDNWTLVAAVDKTNAVQGFVAHAMLPPDAVLSVTPLPLEAEEDAE